jgi:hypothetical protein
MDVCNENGRVVGNGRDTAIKTSLYVNSSALNLKSKIKMKLMLVGPLRTCFPHLVDLSAGLNVLVHQPTDFPQRCVAELGSYPLMCHLGKLDVAFATPITEGVLIRRKAVFIGQLGQRISCSNRRPRCAVVFHIDIMQRIVVCQYRIVRVFQKMM